MRFLQFPGLLFALLLFTTACNKSQSNPGQTRPPVRLDLPAFVVGIDADRGSGVVATDFQLSARGLGPGVNDQAWTWFWDFGDGRTATTRDVTVAYNDPGTYVVTVTATDEKNRAESASIGLTVFGAPGSTTQAPGGAPLPAMIGDVDANNVITLEDCHRILKHVHDLERLPVPDGLLAADVNLDGSITAEDARILSYAVIQKQTVPALISPDRGARGAAVNLISPALLDGNAKAEVRIGGADPYQPYRPILGYATFMIPLRNPADFEKPGSTIQVELLMDGVVAEVYDFELESAPSSTRAIGDDLTEAIKLIGQARRGIRQDLDRYLNFAGATDDEKAVLLGMLDFADQEAKEPEREMLKLLTVMDRRTVHNLERIANANGLQDALSGLRSFVNENSQPDFLLLTGDEVLNDVCRIRNAAKLIDTAGSAIGLACDGLLIAALIAIVAPEPVTSAAGMAMLAAWTKYCATTEVARDLVSIVVSFVGEIRGGVRLEITNPAPEPGEESELRGLAQIGGVDTVCRFAASQGKDKISEYFIKQASQRILKRKLALRGIAAVLEKLDDALAKEFQELLTKAVEAVAGRILEVSGVNELLNDLIGKICMFLEHNVELELELNGALTGPVPNVGTLVMPAPGAGGPARYTCATTQPMEPKVSFTLTKQACGETYQDTQVIKCGSGDVTITMGDNGSLLDDIFEVRVDGATVLTSSVPVRSISTTLNLTFENHVVEMIGLAAPDGVGTYFIDIDGATVLNGPPLTGTNLTAGRVFTWNVSVP